MIPKIIHYCWFGGNPLPKEAKKCIESWKKFCPDYEIKQWDETNFDFSDCEYAKEAYDAKKWAFVSDYARFKILYEFGGLYFDTDVEIIKPMDSIVLGGPFMGCENDVKTCDFKRGLGVNPGLGLGACKHLEFYLEMLTFYKGIHFKNVDGSNNYKTVVEYTTKILRKHGLKNVNSIQSVDGIVIYPKQYFNPMDVSTGKITIEQETVSIHHYSGSWLDKKGKLRGKIYLYLKNLFGKNFADFVRKIFSRK